MLVTYKMTELPHTFCVKANQGNREGFFLIRWSTGETGADGRVVHILKPSNHRDRLYNIHTIPANFTMNIHVSKKGNGNVTRPMRWYFTDLRLTDPDGTRIPVIRVTSRSVLPAMKVSSFIPIISSVATVPIVATVPTVTQIQRKKYTITSIPQRTIRSLLTMAVMNEETCPITSEIIDISNGAITSCFHYFEKEAINKWLSMPNSKDECPICKTPCNSYTVDN